MMSRKLLNGWTRLSDLANTLRTGPSQPLTCTSPFKIYHQYAAHVTTADSPPQTGSQGCCILSSISSRHLQTRNSTLKIASVEYFRFHLTASRGRALRYTYECIIADTCSDVTRECRKQIKAVC